MSEQRAAEQALREREAILASVAQPVWVVDAAAASTTPTRRRGGARLRRPVRADGPPGHATVHYKYPDGSPFPEEECPLTRARLTGRALHDIEDWLVRKDGSIMPVAFSTAPFDLPDGPGSVTAFTDVEERRRAEQAARERDVAQARAAELRAARRRIIEAADAARARLERDLHDGAQQQFVNALLNLQLAERLPESDPDRARDLRATAIDLATTGIAELRDLAAGIHPPILTHRGLGPAVEPLAARLPLPVDVLETPAERLPAPVEASVYFFVSEALTNVVKHADAERPRCASPPRTAGWSSRSPTTAPAAPVRRGGSGLRGLGDRVGALDGALELHSPPGEGTLLRARIPLAAVAGRWRPRRASRRG